MDRTEEKLLVFTDIVLKEAARKKQEILEKAEQTRREQVEAAELRLLQEAHDDIQEALRTLGRASNEEISRTILESKQALFTRRGEILDAVFARVSTRLAAFRETPEYCAYLKARILDGFDALGEGDIRVQTDASDMDMIAGLTDEIGKAFAVEESEEPLAGGCLFINRTTGRMWDDSFARRLETERQSFLEKYNLRLDG